MREYMLRNLIHKHLPLMLCLAVMFFCAESPLYAAKKSRNWRIGLGRLITNTYYGYDTQRRSSDGGDISTDINKTSTGQIYSSSLVFEYIFGGRKSPALFGVEFDYGTSTGIRNYTFEESGSKNGKTTKIGDITESLSTNYLYGGNIFFSDAGEPGFNWSIGLMTGEMIVKHEFTDGGSRDDDSTDSWTNFNSSQSSTLTVPVELMKFGVEYILETSGIRFEYFSTKQTFFGSDDAETKDSSNLGVINSVQKQYETVKLQGGLSLVVFARF